MRSLLDFFQVWRVALFAPLLLLLSGGHAVAGCFPVAQAYPQLIPASLPQGATLQITYLGHSSFLIESAGGVTAVTDYNGAVRATVTPDIVTMNNAHSTHFTESVEPGVEFILRGWDPAGGMAAHKVTKDDVLVRNVPTNVRGLGGTRYNGNSIFVFEIGDLCIAHLGHLHHVLTDQHLADLGIIDILFVPVDGGLTMSHATALEVIRQIGAPLVIPMHFVSQGALSQFVSLIEGRYRVSVNETPTVALSRQTLPRDTFLVLPGF